MQLGRAGPCLAAAAAGLKQALSSWFQGWARRERSQAPSGQAAKTRALMPWVRGDVMVIFSLHHARAETQAPSHGRVFNMH